MWTYAGEDGPTHQPVEVLSIVRATPNLSIMRPADGNEVRPFDHCARWGALVH